MSFVIGHAQRGIWSRASPSAIWLCVCVCPICKNALQAARKGFLCAMWIPSEVSGQGCTSEELCWGEGVAWGSGAGGQGGCVSQSLPAPVPLCQDTAKAEQGAHEKLREMPDLPPSSFSLPCKLAAHSGSLHCLRGLSRAEIRWERKSVAGVVQKYQIPVVDLRQKRTTYAWLSW